MANSDYIKANRRGSREAELSFEHGWKAKLKVHKSDKNYSRKTKHKKFLFKNTQGEL